MNRPDKMRRNNWSLQEEMTMDEITFEIRRWVDKLDQVSIDYEARWGCGRLPLLASPDMALKWDRQWRKLDDAIIGRNLHLVRDLVEGCIRAWAALESAALAAGHKPIAPESWEVRHPDSGAVYRIVKTNYDARAPAIPGVITYSLEEVARILEAQQLVNVVKGTFDGTIVKGVFKEDALPF